MAVLMQAAALLSHLEASGCRMVSAWHEASLDSDGILRGVSVEEGFRHEGARQCLLEVVEILFGQRYRIAGRGPSRRLLTRLLQRWYRSPARLPANRMLTQILDEARFLWRPKLAPARRALMAEQSAGSLAVAGRGAFELLVLRAGDTPGQVEEVLMGPRASALWKRGLRRSPDRACGETKLDRGRRFYQSGQWRRAIEALKELEEPVAWILRADSLRLLGQYRAARDLLESQPVSVGWSAEEVLQHTRVAVDLYQDLGESRTTRSALAQPCLGWSKRQRAGLELLAAEVAGRSGDWQTAMRRRPLLENLRHDAQWSWRWHRLMSLFALHCGELEEAEKLISRPLSQGRGALSRFDRALLWRRLASIRAERGDLAAAERAGEHALRLFESVDESVATATSLWLSDLRLRQGRSSGVEDLLRSAVGETGTPRFAEAPGRDELLARLDLLLGSPGRALERLDSSMQSPSSVDPERLRRCRLLASRALGWLGRGAEARDLLEVSAHGRSSPFEPEELPALWALAGDWNRARESAGGGPVGSIWRSALDGREIDSDDWESLAGLGSYRAARLVFDLQIVTPGRVPLRWLERAAAALRRVGAHSFAERLGRSRQGAWKALEIFLREESRRGNDLGELFTSSGYFDVRLEWRHHGVAQVLVPGHGGACELRAGKLGGELVLSVGSLDPVISALFALAVREYEPDPKMAPSPPSRVHGIVGQSPRLHQALERLERLSASDVAVLIHGETGTGKELVARQLHRLSARSSGPLVTVNCAALSESLLLSDLFGHVRGAFTGAERDRAGVFETATGGTVFLDEIGDLPLAAQGKLLRVLQEGEVRRVGESLPRRIDVRVLAATHRNLRSMVEKKRFRADLFYRLSVGSLNLPPLRQRERDVLMLADHFLERSGHRLTPRARRRLLSHPWPGNVRELKNVLQVAAALSPTSTIDLNALELPDQARRPSLGYHQQVEGFRCELIREALAACDGQRSAAARRLGLSRQAMSYLVRRFGLG